MGDTDGSSSAAQSAQLQDNLTTSPDLTVMDPPSPNGHEGGFFSRVISALSPSQDGAPETVTTPSAPRTQRLLARRAELDEETHRRER